MWKEAEEFLIKDEYISPLIKKYGHCTIKPRDKKYYFEDLVDAIVQQQLSMKAATSIFNKVKEAVNLKSIKKDNVAKSTETHKWRRSGVVKTLIQPEGILAMSDIQLQNCGLSRPKVLYIKDLATRVVQNELKLNTLDKLKDEEIIKELITVKGIGEWTAHMFLMFTLGRSDVFPVGDLGLRNAFYNIFGDELKKPSSTKALAGQMEKFARRWKPYRTIASWYIWKSLE